MKEHKAAKCLSVDKGLGEGIIEYRANKIKYEVMYYEQIFRKRLEVIPQ